MPVSTIVSIHVFTTIKAITSLFPFLIVPSITAAQNLQVCVVAIFSLPTLSASYKTWVLLTSPYNHINQSTKTKPRKKQNHKQHDERKKATKYNQILKTQQKTDTVIDYHFLL